MKRKAYGTYAISKICQVAPITVGRWIEEKKLPCFTTGGGHRRVWENDLITFLTAHNYPIPKDMKTSRQTVILVVDDEAAIRRLIRRVAEKEIPGVQIEEAEDGFEAAEKIFSLTPAVVVLDIYLPGIDGIKVCERIRVNKALKNVKIIAMTGDPSNGMKEKIMKAGANAFMEKPIDIDALLKTIQRFVAR
jgi:CheY-like chemotaxis protein